MMAVIPSDDASNKIKISDSQLYRYSLSFFFYCYRDLRDLHSFPTRRSSDLTHGRIRGPRTDPGSRSRESPNRLLDRSEEHTSELQSPYDLVCRLLLEKKKNLKIL